MPAPMTMTSLVFVLIPETLGREINGLACDGWVVDDPPHFEAEVSLSRQPISQPLRGWVRTRQAQSGHMPYIVYTPSCTSLCVQPFVMPLGGDHGRPNRTYAYGFSVNHFLTNSSGCPKVPDLQVRALLLTVGCCTSFQGGTTTPIRYGQRFQNMGTPSRRLQAS